MEVSQGQIRQALCAIIKNVDHEKKFRFLSLKKKKKVDTTLY